tara:strand:+ start:429 stop:1109 length:681 start_codon:yes stop_codon:yes gene_type:complete
MEYFFNVNTGRVEQRPINQQTQFYTGTNVPVATPFSNMQSPNLGITSVAPSPLSFNSTYMAKQNVDPYSTGIMTQAPPIDFKRFEGITKETDIDDDTQDQVVNEKEKKKAEGLAGLFRAILGFIVPGSNLFMGDVSALDTVKSLNQKARATDFGRSKTLAEFFQKRRERKQAEKARELNQEVYERADKLGFTNEKGGFSTDKATDAGTSLGSGQFSPSTSKGRSDY